MNPGIGAMLHWLAGGSPEDPAKYYGKKITSASLSDDALIIAFDDGVRIKIWDNAQSCCEYRYMTCDDKVDDLVDGVLRAIRVNRLEEDDSEGYCKDVAFLDIQTDKQFITIATHNEHNGYYGGFGLSVKEVKK